MTVGRPVCGWSAVVFGKIQAGEGLGGWNGAVGSFGVEIMVGRKFFHLYSKKKSIFASQNYTGVGVQRFIV